LKVVGVVNSIDRWREPDHDEVIDDDEIPQTCQILGVKQQDRQGRQKVDEEQITREKPPDEHTEGGKQELATPAFKL